MDKCKEKKKERREPKVALKHTTILITEPFGAVHCSCLILVDHFGQVKLLLSSIINPLLYRSLHKRSIGLTHTIGFEKKKKKEAEGKKGTHTSVIRR
jgi:hypothetical protein